MRTSDEIRTEAWMRLRNGGWAMKALLVVLVMSVIFGIVGKALNDAAVSIGIQTWGMFLQTMVDMALSSGLNLAVPSRAVALRMTGASAFKLFVDCIIEGICVFGICGLFLRAAQGDMSRWFARAFGGFARPLGVAWLYFRYNLQIFLWTFPFAVIAVGFAEGFRWLCGWSSVPALSWPFARYVLMLLVSATIVGVPAVIVVYRYSQVWNLKNENPDWTAGQCLATSCRMMKGNLWRRFCLDCAYWKPITFLLLGALVALCLVGLDALALLGGDIGISRSVIRLLSGVGALLWIFCLWGGIVLVAYMAIGQALFYLDLKAADASKELDK